MNLSIVKQIIKDTNMMLISFMPYICCHTFREWWRSLLDYYYNNYVFDLYILKHFFSYALLNNMIKNQEAVLLLRLPLYKFKRHKHSSKSFPLIQFALYVFNHLVQFLNNLYCSPIILLQMLQVWIISFKDINRDSIWCNRKGLCWHYIFTKSLKAFSLIMRGSAFKSLTQLWCS